MTHTELETAINVVVGLVMDYGGSAEYLPRHEMAAHAIVLDNEEIIQAMEAALCRVESFAHGAAVSPTAFRTMPVKGRA